MRTEHAAHLAPETGPHLSRGQTTRTTPRCARIASRRRPTGRYVRAAGGGADCAQAAGNRRGKRARARGGQHGHGGRRSMWRAGAIEMKQTQNSPCVAFPYGNQKPAK